MVRAKHWYTLEWGRYGRAIMMDGSLVASFWMFPSRSARDEWVAAGPDEIGDVGRREVISAAWVDKGDARPISERGGEEES